MTADKTEALIARLRVANTSTGAFYPEDLASLCREAADALSAALADAERYRWIRNDDNRRWWAMFGFVDSMTEDDEPALHELDAAIDAARQKGAT